MTDMVCRKFGYPQIYWIIIIIIFPIITSIHRAMSVAYPIFRDIPTYHLKMYIKWTNHSKSLLITINQEKRHIKSPQITKNHQNHPIKSPNKSHEITINDHKSQSGLGSSITGPPAASRAHVLSFRRCSAVAAGRGRIASGRAAVIFHINNDGGFFT